MTLLRLVLMGLLLGAIAAGCAPKTLAPVAPGAPRHPEFVFPDAAESLPVEVLEEHEAAWQALQGNDARTAERRYTSVLKRAPTFYPAHAGLGYVAMARNNMKAALGHFERALAGNAAYAPALAGKGQAHLALGERGPALASFNAALAADPDLPAVRSSADVLRFQVLQGGVADARKAAEAGRLSEARAGYATAIEASPESPFLYRELAIVEFRDRQLDLARQHAQQAIALEPNDARNHVALADILEALGERDAAALALAKAAAIEPSEALENRIEALRASAMLASMPEEFRVINDTPAITRAQLAALIGVRLEDLVTRAPRRSTGVITDTRGHWASTWILPVARAGFMEVYPNSTFQPGATVRRAELAFSASRILGVIAAGNPALGAAWRNERPRFSDLPAGHLSYPAAAVAVAAGVIRPLESDAFQPSRPVSGEEAIAAVDRLVTLAETRR
jgi:tetratricopeptide (TPR) repeat protein